MVAHGWRWPVSESIEYPYGERFVGHSLNLFGRRPLESRHFIVESQVATGYVATENQGDNTAGHVLVHAGQGNGLDDQPGFFADFAPQPVLDGFIEFQHAAWRLPAQRVAPSDEQCPSVVVGDHARDADRVPCSRRVHLPISTVACKYRGLHEWRSEAHLGIDDVLTSSVDPGSDRPVYKQIADHLRAAIAGGRLHEGDQLPSEAQLMDHYGVARMTIRNAMRLLQDEGLVTAEHGKGVYVRSRPPVRRLASDRFAQRHRKEGKAAFITEAEQAGATPQVDMIEIGESQPPSEIADRLGLSEGAAVVVRSRRYLLDGKPVEIAVSYIPAGLARGTPISDPDPGPGGIYARLEEHGHILERFTEDVTARMPTPKETRLLNLSPGVPVFRLIRTAYETDNRPVEVCDTVMAGDVYQLSYELPAR
jgi:GntR family transcriptional regulator